MNKKQILPLLVLLLFGACHSSKTISKSVYLSDIQRWRSQRIEALKNPDGWLALAGLFWLKQGEQSFGSAASCKLVFPAAAPAKLGVFRMSKDSVWISIAPEHTVLLGDKPIEGEQLLLPSPTGSAPVLHYQALDWTLIQRGESTGVRLWDQAHPARTHFSGIDYFPISQRWAVPAKFIPAKADKTILLENVLGMKINQKVEGSLEFKLKGKKYSIEALDGGKEELFLIFSDASTGHSTYGGGRYLYVPRADAHGQTLIDFNKAENPPCAFTAFATCLLPPKQHYLDVVVSAGEKNWGEH